MSDVKKVLDLDTISRRNFLKTLGAGTTALIVQSQLSSCCQLFQLCDKTLQEEIVTILKKFAKNAGIEILNVFLNKFTNGLPSSILQTVNRTNSTMQLSGFVDQKFARVYKGEERFFYPLFTEDRLNACAAFPSLREQECEDIAPVMEGPSIIAAGEKSEYLRNNGWSKKDINNYLLPKCKDRTTFADFDSGIQDVNGIQTYDSYFSKNGYVIIYYDRLQGNTNQGFEASLFVQILDQPNGRVLSEKDFTFKYEVV